MPCFQNIKKQSSNQHNYLIMDAKDIKKEYTNGEVTIVWQSGKCIHSAMCVKNNPDVFHPKEKPWILPENSTSEKIMDTINKCPSGALSFYLNK
jgi:uncharacterized Fe-S cluster protein YjdI